MLATADLYLRIDPAGGGADWVVENGDLKLDLGLRSTVLVALFSDARLPDSLTTDENRAADPRGVWFDTPTSRYGSLLWQLERAKALPAVETSIRTWVADALAFLRTLGIVEEDPSVEVDRIARNVFDFTVTIARGSATGWDSIWDAEADAIVSTDLGTVRILSR